VRAGIRHKVPEIPFRIDGVLYDPGDISRFDGEELAFFVRRRDEMLVMRDRQVWAPVVQSMFVSNLATSLVSGPVVTASSGSTFPTSMHPHYYCPYPGYHDPFDPFGDYCGYPTPPPPPPPPNPNPASYEIRLDTETLWRGTT
jgi:hypothetical protein